MVLFWKVNSCTRVELATVTSSLPRRTCPTRVKRAANSPDASRHAASQFAAARVRANPRRAINWASTSAIFCGLFGMEMIYGMVCLFIPFRLTPSPAGWARQGGPFTLRLDYGTISAASATILRSFPRQRHDHVGVAVRRTTNYRALGVAHGQRERLIGIQHSEKVAYIAGVQLNRYFRSFIRNG